MVRPLRLEHPGALWHITNRGVEQRDIYLDDHDREVFLNLLAGATRRFRWKFHQYCLMTNHFHLLAETVEPTLSRGMQQIDGEYADYFNQRHRRSGHLFKGRFDAQLVDEENYLLTVARYIVLNPVRARMVESAGDWKWSSYRATAGLIRTPAWLHTETVLDRFDEWDRTSACELYRAFVAAGTDLPQSPWENLVAGLYLGSEAFIEHVKAMTRERNWGTEHLKAQKDIAAIDIDQVRSTVENYFGVTLGKRTWKNELARLAFAVLARKYSIATGAAISKLLSISPSGVSRLLTRAARLQTCSKDFREHLTALQLAITHAIIKV